MNILKKSVAGLLFILVSNASAMQKELTIVIASKSPQKAGAVQEVFQQFFKDSNLHFIAHATPSGIPEQPVGRAVAIQGALNRISGLPKDICDTADYMITVENYIEQEADTKRWYDKGLIVLYKKAAAQEQISETEPVFFDTNYFEEAKNVSTEVTAQGLSITVGQIIAKKFPAQRMVNHQDFHREPEFGGVCRKDLIKAALIKALQDDVRGS